VEVVAAVWLWAAAEAEAAAVVAAEEVIQLVAVVPRPQAHLIAAECERVPGISDLARRCPGPVVATSQTTAVVAAAGAASAGADGMAGDSPSVLAMGMGTPTDMIVTPTTMVAAIWFVDES
jgi:hypothetical protein